MIFALRAVIASLAVFMILLVGVCVVVACTWRRFAAMAQHPDQRRFARLLFALRMAPFAVPLAFVAAVTVPAFLRYEPHFADEPVGVAPLLLAAAFVLLVTAAAVRGWRVYNSAARWAGSAGAVQDAPVVALAGIRRATVLISATAKCALSESELRSAIAHEEAHARSRDNLKKLVAHALRLPGLAALDRAWLDSIEFAADAEAVHSGTDAVDLASALVKVARLQSRQKPVLVTCFADGGASILQRRVERLLNLRQPTLRARTGRYAVLVVACIGAAVMACYPTVLAAAHQMTEFVLR